MDRRRDAQAPGPEGWAARLWAWFRPGSQVPAEVLRKQISVVHDHLPPGALASVIVSIALGMVVTAPGMRRAKLLWITASILVSGLRCLDSRIHRPLSLDPGQLARARRNVNLGALAQGVLWGVAGTFLLPPTALEQLFL